MTGGHSLRALTEPRSFSALVVAADEDSRELAARTVELVNGIPRHASSASEAIACMEQADFDVLFVSSTDCCGVKCQEITDFIDERRDARIPVLFRPCVSGDDFCNALNPRGLYVWVLGGPLDIQHAMEVLTKAARLSRLLHLERHVDEEVDWRVAYCLSQLGRSSE